MTTVEKQSPPNPADDDVYHSDDVGLRDTPPPGPMSVNLQPAPSPPPAVPLPPVSPDSTPDPPNRRASDRQKSQPSQADGVLASYMGDGRWPDILHRSPLPPDEEEEGSVKGLEVSLKEEAAEKKDVVDHVGQLAAIATSALEHERQAIPERLEPAQATSTTRAIAPDLNGHPTDGEPMEDAKPTIPSITASYVGAPRPQPSPDATVKTEIMTSPAGELPPIRQHSPKSGLSNGNGAGSITLPSISAHLRDLNHFPETAATGDSTFSQSPPTRAPRFQAVPGQGSPPKSPNDAFFRELPSPGRAAGSYYNNPNNHQKPSQADVSPYASAGDYSSGNIETLSKNLSIEQPGSIPAMAIDRMSIDGITNPQVGGYQCTYPGCTAQPFQTQYLLNSHANVHSSNRPHYCSVKGCPRSEGGKGFKRKNEMIRHGLVHDSPGYVCPFCPDREHKYPRPDNLQRHVRVHHVDKDKDDPQLREVLSQRPEGPSRGRRRRGGTS